MSKKVIVTNISEKASEKIVKDFFLFCGKIKDFELIKEESSDTQIAYVTFERDTAAKTALMLSSAVISDSQIVVKSADDCHSGDDSSDEYCENEERPKTAVFADILASGFTLQEAIIERGMDFDRKYCVRETLKHYFSNIQDHLKVLDQKYQVTDVVTTRATDIDQKYSICSKSKQVMDTAQEKYKSFLDTPTGRYIAVFLSQLGDIHCRAKQIVEEKKQEKNFNPTPSHAQSDVQASEPVQPFNI